jgi:hypothetical protein
VVFPAADRGAGLLPQDGELPNKPSRFFNPWRSSTCYSRAPAGHVASCVAWGLCQAVHAAGFQTRPRLRPAGKPDWPSHRAQGVVNRDIKLENTLLDQSRRPLIKICDFGYSKHLQKDSVPKSRVGTPGYTGARPGAPAPGSLARRLGGCEAGMWCLSVHATLGFV